MLLVLTECTPAPSCDGLNACRGITGAYARSCIDLCAPVWTGGPGEFCSLSPCDTAAFARGARVCPIGTHCIAHLLLSGEVVNTCDPQARLLQHCDRRTSCGDNLACVGLPLSHDNPDAIARCDNIPRDRMAPPDGSVCWFPAHEGQDCDSNAVDTRRAGALGCHPCEEGTWCLAINQIDPSRPSSTRRVCARTCTAITVDFATDTTSTRADPSQCACGSVPGGFPDGGPPPNSGGAQCVRAVGPVVDPYQPSVSIGPFFCTPCLPDRVIGTCDPQAPDSLSCCDGEAICTSQLVGPMCCRQRPAGLPPEAQGPACDTGSRAEQCCPLSFCNGSGHCEACAGPGMPAGKLACCPGARAVGSGTTMAVCARCTVDEQQIDLANGNRTAAWCSTDSFLVATDPNAATQRVDAAYIPSPFVGYPLQYDGGLGGPLLHTHGSTFHTQYSLQPSHHTFLFKNVGDTAALGEHTPFIELPPDDDGIAAPATVVLPDQTWTDWRMYDAGACSAFFPWSLLALEFDIQVNRAIGAARLIAGPFTTTGLQLTPILQGTPAAPYGLFVPRDSVHFDTSFTTGSVGGCSRMQIALHGDVRLDTSPGFNVGPNAVASDAALMANRGTGRICVRQGAEVACTLPVAPTATNPRWTTHTWTFPLVANFYRWSGAGATDEVMLLQLAFESVECVAVRDEYHCTLPRFITGNPDYCCPGTRNCPVPTSSERIPPGGDPVCVNPARQRISSVFPADTTTNYAPYAAGHAPRVTCAQSTSSGSGRVGGSCGDPPTAGLQFYAPQLSFVPNVRLRHRPVDFVYGARDVVGTVTHFRADVVSRGGPGCFDPTVALIRTVIESHFGLAAQDALASQTTRILTAFGTSAQGNFGISSAQLRGCPGGDADCASTPQFGGSRDRCINQVCDIIQLEARRINVMPDGIDFVLAQTSVDPQAALFTGAPLTPPGSALLPPSFPTPVLSCAPTRLYPTFAGRPYSLTSSPSVIQHAIGTDTNRRSIHAWDSLTLEGATPGTPTSGPLSFCTGSSGEGRCICPQTGTLCTFAWLSVARFTVPPGGNLRCQHNPAPSGALQCCTGTGASLQCATPL